MMPISWGMGSIHHRGRAFVPGNHIGKTGQAMSLSSALPSFGLALMALLPATPALAGGETGLALKQAIPLPDVDGRIDHFAIDVKGQRAFLAALAKNTIEV